MTVRNSLFEIAVIKNRIFIIIESIIKCTFVPNTAVSFFIYYRLISTWSKVVVTPTPPVLTPTPFMSIFVIKCSIVIFDLDLTGPTTSSIFFTICTNHININFDCPVGIILHYAENVVISNPVFTCWVIKFNSFFKSFMAACPFTIFILTTMVRIINR